MRSGPCPAALVLLLLLPMAGCGGDGGNRLAGIAPDDPDRMLFESRCGVCHGPDGRPRGPSAGAADLADPNWQAGLAPGEIGRVVLEGRGKMPSFRGKLTEEEIQRIEGYLQRLAGVSAQK